MTLLHASGVALRHPADARFLLAPADLIVSPAERIGLIGPNGTGKTTLLRLLAGELAPDAGTLHRQRDCRLGYVPQEPRLPPVSTLADYLLDADETIAGIRQAITDIDPAAPDADLHRAEWLDAYLAQGGYEREAQIDEVLAGLGFTPDERTMPLGHLSGGQRTRAELARLLLAPVDLLLLDEPTNHLDWPAREWLETYLDDLDAACVIVSHDRRFLSRVVDRTWELKDGHLTVYEGGYEWYREQKALRERQAWEAFEAQQRRAKAAKQAAERRMQLAREVATTPKGQGIRHGKDFYRAKAARLERTARILRARPQREDEAPKPRLDDPIPVLDFAAVPRSGDPVLTASGLGKTLGGKPLFADLTFEVGRGERVAIVGPNGSGKTTLLRLLLGEMPADDGTIAYGANTLCGLYAQDGENLDPECSALALCTRTGDDERWARTLLACLRIRGEQVHQPVGRMSAGERGKVAIVRLLLSGANLLLLDEPTNHLDLDAREALEGTLRQFPGAIVFVSHDRWFVESLADRVIELGGDGDAG